MGVNYGLILLVGAIALAYRHATSDRATRRSKLWVVGLVALSVLGPGSLWMAVLQVGVCVYVIVHKIVTDELAKSDERGAP